jgi:hypothetical protein
MGTLNIFCSTCNPVRLCQNFGIFLGGGVEHPNPPPPPLRYATETEQIILKDSKLPNLVLLILY